MRTGNTEAKFIWEFGKKSFQEGALSDTGGTGHDEWADEVWIRGHRGGEEGCPLKGTVGNKVVAKSGRSRTKSSVRSEGEDNIHESGI